ncbi:MAG: glycoside hydrolase [Streptosporangiaceae bacterium]|nr:glycoside hydrolase [Streptosporangiaceae bacterium]
MPNADDRPPSLGRRVKLAGGLIAATVVIFPVAGALQPAQADTAPNQVAEVAAHVSGPRAALATPPIKGNTAKHKVPNSAEPLTIGAAAVARAKKQIGKPYVWGATGPHAFDCSGLVQWAYKKTGVHLPRVTYEQYSEFDHKVAWKDLAVGDLVFFSGQNHVGIISKRKGKKLWMIHAPHSGSYVQQVKLDSYRRQTFAGAVRPS